MTQKPSIYAGSRVRKSLPTFSEKTKFCKNFEKKGQICTSPRPSP